jgi:NADH-quinone oxidoreductase subunit G
MCLVEVDKVPKALPACATQVADGMKVFTKSEKALDAQKAVMEFLLVNHPLDCPICDQGGQCELQDISMGFGKDTSRYVEMKRAVKNPDLGPLIATDMTRCIHCMRCVRFGDEIAGRRELGGTFRGENTKVGTYVKKTIKSEVSGNVIDICPVGALTSKPFRFKARAWEMTQTPGVAAHDCLGSNINIGSLRGEVLRVSPKENESINEVWLSDRDRFAYVGVHNKQRAVAPMVKQGGKWKTVSWQEAFDAALECTQKALNAHGVENFGALASASATTEELFLLQKFMRGIGSNNIDHRLMQRAFSETTAARLAPSLGVSIADLSKQDTILLIGSDVQQEQPLAGLRIRQAAEKGAKVFNLANMDYRCDFPVAGKMIVKPGDMLSSLAAITKAALTISGQSDSAAEALLKDIAVTDEAQAIAQALITGEANSLIFGAGVFAHPDLIELKQLTVLLGKLTNSNVGCFTEGANTAGAWIAGALPQRGVAGKALEQTGKNAYDMLKDGMKAFVLLGVEPELDSINSENAQRALKEADSVVALTAFVSDAMLEYADVILPIASFGETSGTFVNIQGDWQSFTGVVAPKGEARPAWKVLRVLGNTFKVDGFDYTDSEQVLAEVRTAVEASSFAQADWGLPAKVSGHGTDKPNQLQRIGGKAIYSTDQLVRHSEPLQAMMAEDRVNAIQLNEATVAALNVKAEQIVSVRQGGGQVRLPVVINNKVPEGCALIHSALPESVGLGDAIGIVEVTG